MSLKRVIEKRYLVCSNCRMRILQLATSDMGGAGIAATRCHSALVSEGANSVLVTTKRKFDAEGTQKIERGLWNSYRSSATTFLQARLVQNSIEPITSFSLQTFDSRFLDDYRPDVVHLHSFYNLVSIEFLKKLQTRNIPAVITLHDQRWITGGCHYSGDCRQFTSGCKQCPLVHKPFQKFVRNQRNILGEKFAGMPKLFFVSPSLWLKKEAIESGLASDKNTAFVRNPIPEVFNKSSNLSSISRKNIVIGFIAADLNGPYKGFRTFIDAINLLSDTQAQNVELHLIGRGNIEGINSNIEVVRKITMNDQEMAIALQEIDFLVVSSTQDNHPNVISEAQMSGVTVIGARVGGIENALHDLGMPTFESGNTSELAKLLSEIRPTENRAKIAKKAEEIYSYKSYSESIQGIYSRLIC